MADVVDHVGVAFGRDAGLVVAQSAPTACAWISSMLVFVRSLVDTGGGLGFGPLPRLIARHGRGPVFDIWRAFPSHVGVRRHLVCRGSRQGAQVY